MNLTGVVQELRKERDRTQTELERLDAALTALGGLDRSIRGVQPKRRTMSAAGRARIVAAQKARWAKAKGKAKGFAVPGSRSNIGGRVMSAAARRKIAAAQRARWARVRSQEQVKTSTQKRHWSQLPENKARVLQLVKRMNRARRAA
jgi:hypothetical protein